MTQKDYGLVVAVGMSPLCVIGAGTESDEDNWIIYLFLDSEMDGFKVFLFRFWIISPFTWQLHFRYFFFVLFVSYRTSCRGFVFTEFCWEVRYSCQFLNFINFYNSSLNIGSFFDCSVTWFCMYCGIVYFCLQRHAIFQVGEECNSATTVTTQLGITLYLICQ